jgi:hypothetical protein
MRSKSEACAICGTVGDLRDSHVIPEFAYGPIYDEGHKMIAFGPLEPGRSWRLQKGLREPLLCLSCEQLLNNNYERWFKEFWFDNRPLAALESRSEGILSVPDAGRFKLFHLSVLLRAALARHAQWREVSLGERHRTRITEMVLSGNPGEPHEYPIVCCAIRRSHEDPGIWWDLVAPPNPGRMDGMRFYQFTFGGCGWLYYVSSHRMPLVDTVCLQPDGTLPVIKREWAAFRRYRPRLTRG